MIIKRLTLAEHRALMTDFFYTVFTGEPWNDDWSNTAQLDAYMTDLAGNANSLCYGFFEDGADGSTGGSSGGQMLALAIGSIKHWFRGTEYAIDELCVRTDMQGKGIGSAFLEALQNELAAQDIHTIYLETDDWVPAFEFYKKRGFIHIKEHVSLYKSF
jgi:aminoglycoside 6'-N-acetyltransferase I